jgi:hypothetical protein
VCEFHFSRLPLHLRPKKQVAINVVKISKKNNVEKKHQLTEK